MCSRLLFSLVFETPLKNSPITVRERILKSIEVPKIDSHRLYDAQGSTMHCVVDLSVSSRQSDSEHRQPPWIPLQDSPANGYWTIFKNANCNPIIVLLENTASENVVFCNFLQMIAGPLLFISRLTHSRDLHVSLHLLVSLLWPSRGRRLNF